MVKKFQTKLLQIKTNPYNKISKVTIPKEIVTELDLNKGDDIEITIKKIKKTED